VRLWPKPRVRHIRFHDLRHTTASLLMMAGANPAAVQRIMRHSEPRITTEVYGHLAPGYLRPEVDRLSFRRGGREGRSRERGGVSERDEPRPAAAWASGSIWIF
jgi:hypothetical protein